jgi:hypothetical protein
MQASLAASTSTTRTERIVALLRQAQEECQGRPQPTAEPSAQELLDTVAEVIEGLDHRNLNEEAPEFAHSVPTAENLAGAIEKRLDRRWAEIFPGEWPRLDRIGLRETKRNSVELARVGQTPASAADPRVGLHGAPEEAGPGGPAQARGPAPQAPKE